jgi:hypothetical protein
MDFHQYPRWKGERATQPRAFLGGQARQTPLAPSCDSSPVAALMADQCRPAGHALPLVLFLNPGVRETTGEHHRLAFHSYPLAIFPGDNGDFAVDVDQQCRTSQQARKNSCRDGACPVSDCRRILVRAGFGKGMALVVPSSANKDDSLRESRERDTRRTRKEQRENAMKPHPLAKSSSPLC